MQDKLEGDGLSLVIFHTRGFLVHLSIHAVPKFHDSHIRSSFVQSGRLLCSGDLLQERANVSQIPFAAEDLRLLGVLCNREKWSVVANESSRANGYCLVFLDSVISRDDCTHELLHILGLVDGRT